MLTLAEKRWFLSGSKKLMMLLKANQKKVCNFKTTKNGSKVKKEDTAPSNNFFELLPKAKQLIKKIEFRREIEGKCIFFSVAKQRLGFLNKKGFDRFGNNKLFAPLMKWETFKEQLVQINDNAQSYENAYNGIRASVERQEGIKQVLQALPLPAKIQVHKEKERLVEARRIALSEKRAYGQVGTTRLFI